MTREQAQLIVEDLQEMMPLTVEATESPVNVGI